MQHLSLPVVITGPGQYVTRGGELVTVTAVRHNRADGHYSNGINEWWSCRGGRVLPSSLSQNDVMAPAPTSWETTHEITLRQGSSKGLVLVMLVGEAAFTREEWLRGAPQRNPSTGACVDWQRSEDGAWSYQGLPITDIGTLVSVRTL